VCRLDTHSLCEPPDAESAPQAVAHDMRLQRDPLLPGSCFVAQNPAVYDRLIVCRLDTLTFGGQATREHNGCMHPRPALHLANRSALRAADVCRVDTRSYRGQTKIEHGDLESSHRVVVAGPTRPKLAIHRACNRRLCPGRCVSTRHTLKRWTGQHESLCLLKEPRSGQTNPVQVSAQSRYKR
jgi:hypothetical protein